jgi:pilus assembly protein CpaB
VLGGLALTLGGLAASDVAGREAALDRRVGALVPVVVARADVEPGRRLRAADLAVRQVPQRFAPRGAYGAPAQVAGQRAGAPIVAGADVTAAVLEDPARAPAGAPVGKGERVADVLASAPAGLVVPGARVDVLVTREGRPGAPGQTRLALEDVEVLTAAPAQRPTAAPRACRRRCA